MTQAGGTESIIPDCSWDSVPDGWCVLTLAILATGAQAKDVSSPRGSRGHMEGEGVIPQETYHLEAYD